MDTLQVILIDDERRVRNTLKRTLEECGGVEIIAEADTLESAREALSAFPQADGIFLDIQFPGGTGFDLVPDIPDMKKVVFVTAYDQYAIRAFEVNALDYIMKPASPERLEQSLRRLRIHAQERTKPQSASETPPQGQPGESTKSLTANDQLLLKFGTKSRFVPVSDIVFVRSADNYTELHIKDGSTALMRKTLEEWAESLPTSIFLRLHRSTLVQKSFVEELSLDGTKYAVRLQGVEELFPVSRSYSATVREALQK
ncbi:MAG: LytTR family DNA-binding domain-containing protein [Candidatus Kapabacteria bacterium]|jgi:two-component system LytT family response regulator|nr:LytTR family DNA-binding domain-containing protein [Candidatus Kapabacteria bacterium]